MVFDAFSKSESYSLQARRVDAALGVASAVMLAVAVTPGSSAKQKETDHAVSLILARASEIAKAAMSLVGRVDSIDQAASLRNRIRQYAVDAASLDWRLHQGAKAALDRDQLDEVFKNVAAFSDEDPNAGDVEAHILPIAAERRLAHLSALSIVREAVADFSYFQEDASQIIEHSFAVVIEAVATVTDSLMEQMELDELPREQARAAVEGRVINTVAKIYGETYRSIARCAIKALASMQPVEKLRQMQEYKSGSWPTMEISASFHVAIERTLEMVASVSRVKDKGLSQPMKIEPREAL